MQNHKSVLFIAAWLSGVAYAKTPPPQPPVMEEYTLQRLEQIQAETVMLEAKAARARIQRELEDSGVDARTANLPINGRELAILPRAGAYRQWKKFTAVASSLWRVWYFPMASEQIAGTRFLIEAISASEVRVADGNDKRILAFY